MKKSFTAAEVATLVGGTIVGDATVTLTGFAPATTARAGDLTFAENQIFFERALLSAASAILVDGAASQTAELPENNRAAASNSERNPERSSNGTSAKTLIRVPNARIGFAKVLPVFFPEPEFAPGIHPTAVVAETAQIDPTAHIGPHCVVCDGVKIGRRAVLQSLAHIGARTVIGDESNIFPNVTIYPRTEIGARVRIHAGSVIGSDGFGYVMDSGFHRKIPQIGQVIIRDDVEIGAGVTIDRGALGATEIGKGTKIDNLVQIAHNVTIGEHSVVVSQVGIAGSTKVGSYTVLAGQVGLAGHLKIGNRVTVAAQSGVMNDIPDGEKWFGSPALPDRQMKRQLLAAQKLPELLRRVAELERKLEEK